MEKRVADLIELVDLAEDDVLLQEEITDEVVKVANRLEELELAKAFSSEYDARNAILAVHAGAGGTESQDWAEMLQRMYLRWSERNDYRAEILDTSPGDEAGIKSSVILINGDYATGYLKSELAPGTYDFYLCGRRDMIRDATAVIDGRFGDSRLFIENYD